MVKRGILKTVLLASSVMVTACAPTLTTQAMKVRRFSNDAKPECRYLGLAHGSFGMGMTFAGDRKGALVNLRNEVARMGGNWYRLEDSTTELVATTLTAEVYECP